MPTPAVHLALAEKMLRRDDLSLVAGRLLREHRGPFLLGHTAPDVRTISGQDREECHFYDIPRTSKRSAYLELFARHPSLRNVDRLAPSQIAFVAGYIAHLELDELWLDHVFYPFLYGEWATLRERLFLHNVLRTWVDQRAQEALTGTVAGSLRLVQPSEWLPFVRDCDLRVWRDWLVRQLQPGRKMETAEVLAGRMGVPASGIHALVDSRSAMEERVFRRFPRSALESFCQLGYERGVALIEWYIGGSAHGKVDLGTPTVSLTRSADCLTIQEAT